MYGFGTGVWVTYQWLKWWTLSNDQALRMVLRDKSLSLKRLEGPPKMCKRSPREGLLRLGSKVPGLHVRIYGWLRNTEPSPGLSAECAIHRPWQQPRGGGGWLAQPQRPGWRCLGSSSRCVPSPVQEIMSGGLWKPLAWRMMLRVAKPWIGTGIWSPLHSSVKIQ